MAALFHSHAFAGQIRFNAVPFCPPFPNFSCKPDTKSRKPIPARPIVANASNGGLSGGGFTSSKEVVENMDGSIHEYKTAQRFQQSQVYPMMRAFQTGLCMLELTGDADPKQVIESMAADGGVAALQELEKGKSLMSVQCIIPCKSGAISTKLLAPTLLVLENAKLSWTRKSPPELSKQHLENTTAKAFEAVEMHRFSEFKICINAPGKQRNVASLTEADEADGTISLESCNAKAFKEFSEALASYSIVSVNRTLANKNRHWRFPNLAFKYHWLPGSRPRVRFSPVAKAEVNLKSRLSRALMESQLLGSVPESHAWWPMPSDLLIQIKDRKLVSWVHEYLPIHKLEIDLEKLGIMVKEGQNHVKEKTWKVHLTHAQMVDLANAIDLFYGDHCTCPGEALQRDFSLDIPNKSRNKAGSWIIVALLAFMGMVALVSMSVSARLRIVPSYCAPWLKEQVTTVSGKSLGNCKKTTVNINTLPSEDLQKLCSLVIGILKDSFMLSERVESHPDLGAWIGKDAHMQRLLTRAGTDGTISIASQSPTEDEDLLLFQVTLLRDGTIIGFRPANKAAVKHWASYPFTRLLYNSRRLGPGIMEKSVKYKTVAEDCAVIELIVSTDMTSNCALARPVKTEQCSM